MSNLGSSCAGGDAEKKAHEQLEQQKQQQSQQPVVPTITAASTKPGYPGWSTALMRGCNTFEFEPGFRPRKGMNGTPLNIRRVASLFLSAAALALNAVSYSTHRWATMTNVPVNRYSLPLLFKDEYLKDTECRTPLCHLLDLRRDGHLQATVYRGILKRCEEIEKRVGQDAMFVMCRENPENYNAEVAIVQRLQFAGMIFQASAVFASITILTLIRLAESRRRLASFLGSLFPSLLGALLTGLGLLIFSEHLLKGETLDYSFWMAAISGLLSVGTAVLICGDMVTCPLRGGHRHAQQEPGAVSVSGSGNNLGSSNPAPPLPSNPPPPTPQLTVRQPQRPDDPPPVVEYGQPASSSKQFGFVPRPPV